MHTIYPLSNTMKMKPTVLKKGRNESAGTITYVYHLQTMIYISLQPSITSQYNIYARIDHVCFLFL